MKTSVGIVRKCDFVGRFVIPVEYRRVLKLDYGDSVEIFTEEGATLILKKYAPHCVICGEARKTVTYRGELICPKCIQELKEQAKAPVVHPDDLTTKRKDIAVDSLSSCD